MGLPGASEHTLKSFNYRKFSFDPGTVAASMTRAQKFQDVREVTNDLMYVDLPIRSIEECREMLINETNMPPGMFCAGYLEGGRDACQVTSSTFINLREI